MSFRYVNPGYVYLLDSNVTATQITGNTYSRTGVAFTQTNLNAGVTIPQFKQGDDFWAKFDVYISGNITNKFYCFVNNVKKNGFSLAVSNPDNYPLSGNDCSAFYRWNGSDSQFSSSHHSQIGVIPNAVNSFVMHIKHGDSATALIEVFINGNEFTSVTSGAMTYSSSYPTKVLLYATDANVKFSNVIFSDTEISPKEQAIALPISATATDMTADENGMYTAATAGQTLLQTPDITALAQEFSGKSKITGIQVVGNPAYKTSTGLETMIGLSKSGNVTTEHGSYTLGADSTALVMDGWGLSGVTLNDLPNMQFGWKAAD